MLEPPQTGASCTLHTLYPLKRCSLRRFGTVVQAQRTSSNLLKLHPYRDSKVFKLLLHTFGVVRLYRTVSNFLSSGDTRCAGCTMHRFGEVQAHRTSSNLIKLHPHRDSTVYRRLSPEFGVVGLDRTFSDCICTGVEGVRVLYALVG